MNSTIHTKLYGKFSDIMHLHSSPLVGQLCPPACSPVTWPHRWYGWVWPLHFPALVTACADAQPLVSAFLLGLLLHPWLLLLQPFHVPLLRCSADQNKAQGLSIKWNKDAWWNIGNSNASGNKKLFEGISFSLKFYCSGEIITLPPSYPLTPHNKPQIKAVKAEAFNRTCRLRATDYSRFIFFCLIYCCDMAFWSSGHC